MEDTALRNIYLEICNGYSKNNWKGSIVYIKHLSTLEAIELDCFYENKIEETKNKGIKTRQQKLEWLNEQKLWTKKDDQETSIQQEYVNNLIKTKEKLFIKNQIAQHQKMLDEEQIKLNNLINKRESLIGLTAETIADQRSQFNYVYSSFFRDIELKEKFFTINFIDNLDDEESLELLNFYIKTIEKFQVQNIEKIAISNYFTNSFYICGDNIKDFFGKPLYLLTNYQNHLVSLGQYFRNLLSSNSDLPEDVKGDPEKIKIFIQKAKNLQEALDKNKSETGRVGIVGATAQDFKELGIENNREFLNEKGPSGVIK